MITELTRVIDSVGKDKGIDRERIISAVEEAVLSAAEKLLKSKNQDKELDVYYNPEEGEVELFEYKEVVETVTEPELEISLAEASELDPETELGDMIGVKISPEYTRIAIHNAKQKVLQKLKEAEGKVIYEEFIGRKGNYNRRHSKKDRQKAHNSRSGKGRSRPAPRTAGPKRVLQDEGENTGRAP